MRQLVWGLATGFVSESKPGATGFVSESKPGATGFVFVNNLPYFITFYIFVSNNKNQKTK